MVDTEGYRLYFAYEGTEGYMYGGAARAAVVKWTILKHLCN